MSTLRELWDSGDPTIGGWCSIPSAFSAELMGRVGFDWVCVDTQHGLIGYDAMAPMLQALSITKTPPFVRVPWNQPDHIMKALDGGAQGVVVPMVNNAEEARRAVDAAKYPPLGSRSWGPTRAAFELPNCTPDSVNERTIVAPMIETPDGFANLDEILAEPGVGAVYVGPSDLAVSHGIKAGDSEHTRMIEHIADRCEQYGTVAGIHCDSIQTVHRWRDVGYPHVHRSVRRRVPTAGRHRDRTRCIRPTRRTACHRPDQQLRLIAPWHTQILDVADIVGVELVVIDADTRSEEVRRELAGDDLILSRTHSLGTVRRRTADRKES